MAVARRDAQRPDAPAPPRALRPFHGFSRLPDRVRATVARVLRDDDVFRLRVLEQVELDQLSAGSQLFLARPEGWEEELQSLVVAAEDAAHQHDEDRRLGEALQRAQQLEATVAELGAERGTTSAELEATQRRLAEMAHRIEVAEVAVAEVTAELRQTEGERAEAVRQLKAAERLGLERLERVRVLEAQLEEAARRTAVRPEVAVGPEAGDGAEAGAGAEEAAAPPIDIDAVAMAAESAKALAATLSEVVSRLRAPASHDAGWTDPTPGADEPSAAGTLTSGAKDAASGPTGVGRQQDRVGQRSAHRRAPVRVGRGLRADSVDGLAELLRRPETLVLVDGYNVSMAGWPTQPVARQRDSLVGMLGGLAAATGSAADVHVVFDGAHDGRRPVVTSPLPVRVHFTEAGVEADDRLLDFVDSASPDLAVVVVSSDGRVRDGARDRGAAVVSSQHLLALGRS